MPYTYTIDNGFTLVSDMGTFAIEEIMPHWIKFNSLIGDVSGSFLFDELYEVRGSLGAWQFRFNGKVHNHDGANRTLLYNVQWNNGAYPTQGGYYNVRHLASERLPIYGRTLCMIGDSITWWESGGWFRQVLRSKGLKYDFSGNHIDIFGARHAGEGGSSSQAVIDRLATIPTSDSYFILIGTNDRDIDTIANIQYIIGALRARECCSKIYISTLLPRTDAFNSMVNTINTQLRSLTLGYRVYLIDSNSLLTGTNFLSNLNDTLHPSLAGYEILCDVLAPRIL